MAKFGRRFRKARQRRQKRRQETIQTFIDNRTKRIEARQTGKTDRVGLRQQGKSDRVQSKSEGGFFLPQSVEARQDALMQGLQTAGTIGLGIATGGASTALGGIASGLGNVMSDVEFPYGAGFQTSGFEMDFDSGAGAGAVNNKIFGLDPMLVYVGGAGLLAFLLLRR